MNKKWLEIKNQAGITEIYINGDIESDSRNDGFMELIGLKDTNIYPSEIKKALDSADLKDIHVHINSYGGDLFAGIAICNMLKAYKGKTIAYVDGIAASAASIIACGCDEIKIPSNAYLMIHRAMTYAFGNVDDFEKTIKTLEKLEEGIVNTYMEKVVEGVTEEQIINFMKEEKWFTGEEAAQYFNIINTGKFEILNFVGTNGKFKNIPKQLINNFNNKELDLQAKEKARIENLSKEIDIALALGGI